MRVDLIYPPLTDPTVTYHSLMHLSAHLARSGRHGARVRDLNARCVSRALEAGYVRARQREAAALMRRPGAGAGAVDLMRLLAFDPERVAAAAALMRDAQGFFEAPRYTDAALTVLNWIEALSGLGVPGAFSGGFDVLPVPGGDPDDLETLLESDYLDRLAAPLAPALRAELDALLASGPRLVGLGVTYRSQLPFALWTARELRRAAPELPIVAGGTEIATVWKCTDRADVARIFADLDALVLGDGETAMLALADLWGGIADGEPPTGNTVMLRGARSRPLSFEARIEPLRLSSGADYGPLRGEPILAPAPFAYYSPSRGCYWNKCTFCDYGTNTDRPTAPWRQKPVPEAVAELKALSGITDLVYFSVDVLAPGWLLRLAAALVEEGVRIAWSAELRVEARFDAEACALLRRSGCVALSFGFESASPRILRLIDKGTDPDAMRETLVHVARAGIAVQVMGFTGFPTETHAEAMETVRYLDALRPHWSVAGIGTFHLTPGAMVAKDPAAFGIARVAPRRPGRIERMLRFEAPGPTEAERAEIDAARASLATNLFDRPFAGGIDCAHSILHYARHGPRFPEEMRQGHFGGGGGPRDFAPRATLVRDMPRAALEAGEAARRKVVSSLGGPAPERLDMLVSETGAAIPAIPEIRALLSACGGARSGGWGGPAQSHLAGLLRRSGMLRRVAAADGSRTTSTEDAT